MDTQERNELNELEENGRSLTDKGPYFHNIHMEGYKNSARGKLGGAVVGLGVGGAVGAIAAAITAVASGGLAIPAIGMIVAGCAAGGSLYGMHEFSDVGKVSGTVAAAHKLAEARLKEFENAKLGAVMAELHEIKARLGDEKTAKEIAEGREPTAEEALANARAVEHKQMHDYPTQHCDDHHCSANPKGREIMFWDVAAVGAIAGAVIAAALVAGGFGEHIIEAIGDAGHHISHAGLYMGAIVTGGLFGASFGFNRDWLRKTFDVTDPLLEGEVKLGVARAMGKAQAPVKAQETTAPAVVVEPAFLAPDLEEPVRPDTYHRDRVTNAAKEALLRLDPNTAIRH